MFYVVFCCCLNLISSKLTYNAHGAFISYLSKGKLEKEGKLKLTKNKQLLDAELPLI